MWRSAPALQRRVRAGFAPASLFTRAQPRTPRTLCSLEGMIAQIVLIVKNNRLQRILQETLYKTGKNEYHILCILQNANEMGRLLRGAQREPEVGAIPDGRSEERSPAERLR